MSSSFPIDIAQLVALYMQCITYGMVLITVAYGLRVLIWSHEGHLKRKKEVSWIMVGTTIAMFTIATLEMAFGLLHMLQAFIWYPGPGGAIDEFEDISNWVNVMRTADYILQTFIGDGIMVYRCYIVYDRNWKIVLVPVLLWLGETACGWVEVYIEATLHTAATLNDSRLLPFITSILSLTLAMTTITTGLIVYRIMQVTRGVNSVMHAGDSGTRRLTRVVRILVESGLLYTVSVIVFFGTFLASNNAQYGVSDVVVQLIPISFTLILIRVDQGIAVEANAVQNTPPTRWDPVKFPLPGRTGTLGSDVSQGTRVSRSDFCGSHTGTYGMKETSPSDRDGVGEKTGQPEVDISVV